MFSEFEITKEGFGVDNEIVMDYIEKDLNGTVPEKYKEPEGRFINTNGKESSDTRSDDIIILHTNDVHCGVQDTIGYDGLYLYKNN